MIRFPGFIRTAINFLEVVTDKISESTAAAGVTIDGCLIKDGAAAKTAAASKFSSAEITANGAAQATAHGLGAAPTQAWAVFTAIDGNANTIGPITISPTDLTVTVTTGQKYRLYAVL